MEIEIYPSGVAGNAEAPPAEPTVVAVVPDEITILPEVIVPVVVKF
jgi:hypothetical protein